MKSIPRPDHSERPLQCSCTATLNAEPSDVYEAFTSRFDLWFAQPGAISMVPEPGRPYFFYNKDEWGRHPHYGRFLELIENEVVEMTWMTGNGTQEGTAGAETLLRIEIAPAGAATKVVLTHSGFVSEESRLGHEENWPLALVVLEEALAGQGETGR